MNGGIVAPRSSMGTWGPGNLQNDYALDELGERSRVLIEALLERARRKTSRESDEYDYTTLFVEIEIVFALHAKRLLETSCLPPAEEIEQLKQSYLRDWDAYIDSLQPTAGFKRDRRRVIVATFNRLKRICLLREG
jgi:hypothetical protein